MSYLFEDSPLNVTDPSFQNGTEVNFYNDTIAVHAGPEYLEMVIIKTSHPDGRLNLEPEALKIMHRDYPLTMELFSITYNKARSTEAYTVPAPKPLNRFKQRYLEPAGAHRLEFVYAEGNAEQGDFTSVQVAGFVAEGKLPIGNHLFWLWHDSKDHSLAAACLPDQSMRVLVQLARYATVLHATDPEASKACCDAIAESLDFHTEYNTSPLYDFAKGKIIATCEKELEKRLLKIRKATTLAEAKQVIAASQHYIPGGITAWEDQHAWAYYEGIRAVLKGEQLPKDAGARLAGHAVELAVAAS